MITCNILFSGIGAQEAALKRLGLDFKVVGISEIDKYAIQSYEAINGATRNYGDITKIPFLDYADLWTYSSPCQDFSTAGKQQGIYNADGSLTRSGLLKHVERLLETSVALGNQPKYLLMENVKGLVSKKFKPDFLKWLDKLKQLGYNNYWQVLNAKDYGIPQNRERVFVVSIRKDVDSKGYTFPTPVPLEKRLKDMLEPIVDEKYYLNDEKVKKFIENFREPTKEPLACASRGRNPENPSDRTVGIATEQRLEINNTGCSNTLTSVQKDNYVVEPMAYDEQNGYIRKDGCVGTLTTDGSSPKHNNRVIEPFIADDTQGFDGIRRYDNYSPTLRSERSGLKVVEPKVIQVGNIISTSNWNNPQIGRVYDSDGCSPTLNTCGGGSHEPKITEGYRIRKLTPKECWRLMGFTDVEFECAKLLGVSNNRLYQQAGNSIVVDVLVGIFRELLNDRL